MCFAQREFVVGRISRGLRGLHGLHGLAKLLRYFACFNPFNPRNPRLISSSCAKPQTGKPPAVTGGLLLVQKVCYLPASLEAGSATRAAVRSAAKDVTAGDKLDPKGTVAFVVRGGVGLAQRIQAVLRRTRGCGGESRQLEHHPRTGIQFRHAKGQRRPLGGYPVLGTRSYVG